MNMRFLSNFLYLQKLKVLYFCVIIITINVVMVNGTAFAGTDRDVIIGFHKPVGPSEEALIHSHGGVAKKSFHLIPAIAARIPEDKIEEMKKDPRIAYIEDEKIYNATDEYTNSWGVQHIGSKPVHDQNITGAGIKVAILDTGIDYNHEDLKDNYKGGYNFVANNTDPWDDNCLTLAKTCHGTHVAGIVAAEKNGIGVVGVAPNASLYAVKVLHASGFGDTSWIISGLQWTVDNHMNIASMSFGGPDSQALHDAVDNAYKSGILLVASAGNTGGSVTYPAAYDSVIAVTATYKNDTKASFSSIGPEIELAAPGVDIYSTVAVCTPLCISGYDYRSGTSMAAPHVTGVAALIFSAGFKDVNGDGVANNKDVRELLHDAIDLGSPGRDSTYGFGLVDAPRVVLGIIELPIIRTKGSPNDDAKTVSLWKGNYSVKISNVNLSKLDMEVYENGTIRKDLSFKHKFNSSTDIKRDLQVNSTLTIRFTPYDGQGLAYVTIKKKV